MNPANGHNSAPFETFRDRAWTVVPTRNPGGVNDGLGGVAATSRTAAWAVGSTNDGTHCVRTLVEHTC